jgi:hypothetical protein
MNQLPSRFRRMNLGSPDKGESVAAVPAVSASLAPRTSVPVPATDDSAGRDAGIQPESSSFMGSFGTKPQNVLLAQVGAIAREVCLGDRFVSAIGSMPQVKFGWTDLPQALCQHPVLNGADRGRPVLAESRKVLEAFLWAAFDSAMKNVAQDASVDDKCTYILMYVRSQAGKDATGTPDLLTDDLLAFASSTVPAAPTKLEADLLALIDCIILKTSSFKHMAGQSKPPERGRIFRALSSNHAVRRLSRNELLDKTAETALITDVNNALRALDFAPANESEVVLPIDRFVHILNMPLELDLLGWAYRMSKNEIVEGALDRKLGAAFHQRLYLAIRVNPVVEAALPNERMSTEVRAALCDSLRGAIHCVDAAMAASHADIANIDRVGHLFNCLQPQVTAPVVAEPVVYALVEQVAATAGSAPVPVAAVTRSKLRRLVRSPNASPVLPSLAGKDANRDGCP